MCDNTNRDHSLMTEEATGRDADWRHRRQLVVVARVLGTMDQPEESSSNPPRRIRRGNVREEVLWRGAGHDNLLISLGDVSENVLEASSGFPLFV